MNVTLLGKKIFVFVIKKKILRCNHPGLAWTQSPITGVLKSDRKYTETHRGEGHMKVVAEIKVMDLKAKKGQGLPIATRS